MTLFCLLPGVTTGGEISPKRNQAVDDYFMTPPKPDQRGLSFANGQLLLNGKPYRGIGANYVAAFSNTINNPEDTSTEEAFRILAEQNIPFIRSPVIGWGPDGPKLYLSDKAEYFRRMDQVVALAEKHHIGIIFNFFWSGWMSATTGETNLDAWVDPKSKTHQLMATCVQDMVTRYRESPAIWGWEWGNELVLNCHLPNAEAFHIKPEDNYTFETMRKVYEAFAREVRKYDTWRIISSGDTSARESAWHNWKENSWTLDKPYQFAQVLSKNAPDPISVLSIHAYGDDFKPNRMNEAVAVARRINKPLFVGEFGVSGPHTDASEKEFRKQLAILDQEKVPLAAVWEFDLTSTNHPRAEWVIAPGSDKFYMLEAIGKH